MGIAGLHCPYNRANLMNSSEMTKNSMSIEMWSQIEREIPPDASGPEVMMAIIMAHQITSASITQAILEEIKGMKLNEQAVDDVVKFSKKVSELAERIEGSGPAPNNLAQVILPRTLVVISLTSKSRPLNYRMRQTRSPPRSPDKRLSKQTRTRTDP
jgi:hypothetical protein